MKESMKILDAIVERAANPPRSGMMLSRVDVGSHVMSRIRAEVKTATGIDLHVGSIVYKGITICNADGFGTHRVDLTWTEYLTRDIEPLLEDK